MKKTTAFLLAAICFLCLIACSKTTGAVQEDVPPVQATPEVAGPAQPESGNPNREDPPQQTEPPTREIDELVGPWHLDSWKNDLDEFAASLDLFPGYGEWGASMEIQSDGQMNWYIGAFSWGGTYTLEGDVLHVRTTSDLDQSERLWDLRITTAGDMTRLEMDAQDRTVYWVYGDEEEPWKTALREDLAEKYGVLPEYYEDLGGGIYQVYMEVGGEIVSFVTVDSATGDYHG